MSVFRNRDTERVFNREHVRWLPPDIQDRARFQLDRLLTEHDLDALRSPPSNRLEPLRGNRAGQYSIRINAQWRVCFRWTPKGAADIEITDYH